MPFNIKSILIFFLIILSPIISADNLHERDLGLENSTYLKKLVADTFYEGGAFSLSKLEKFREKGLINKKEEIKLIVGNLRSENEISLQVAEKKALEDTKIKSIDWILANLENLKNISGQKALESKLKDIMKIHMALIRGSRDGSALHAIKSMVSLLFKKHHVPVEESKRTRASNLGNPTKNRYYAKEELNQMIKQGIDLSEIDPVDTSFWSRPENIAAKDPLYKKDKTGDLPHIFYFSRINLREGNPKIKVKEHLANGKVKKWKVKFGREVNPEVFMSRFMNLLGYHSDETYYIKEAKIYFENEEEYQNMLMDWFSYYNKSEDVLSSRYIKNTGEDEKGFFAVFHEAVIEARSNKILRVGDFHATELGNWERREVRALLLIMGFVNSPDYKPSRNNKVKLIKNGKNLLNWEIQELVHDLGFAFGDQYFTNAPNAYKWSFLKKTKSKLKIKYSNNQWIDKNRNPFQQASYSDLKWMARYMVQITRSQLESLAQVAGWPHDVAKLMIEKMVVRRNEIVKAFDLEGRKIDGQLITLWDEVVPEEFSYGKYIKNGKLEKEYQSLYSPINFVKDNFMPDEMTKLGRILIGPLGNATKSIPWHRMGTIPTETTSVVVEEMLLGVGVGFRWAREIKRNPNAKREGDAWVTIDILKIFGNIGFSADIPLGNSGLEAELSIQALMGKSFRARYYSATPMEALKGRIKLLASLPFKKWEIIKKLKPGEMYSDGLFVGVEAKQSISTNTLVGIGTGIEQEQIFLNRTIVEKGYNGETDVSKEFAQDFTFSYKAFLKLFKIMRIDFFSAALTWGTRDKKTWHFKLGEKASLEEMKAFNLAAFTNKKNHPLLENRPHTKTKEKFYESSWLFGFGGILAIGRETKGTYITRIRPNGETKRYYNYQTMMKTNNMINSTNKFYKLIGHLEFSDKDFKNVTDSNISLEVEIRDDQTEYKDMKKRVKYVNNLVNDKRFFQYTPELHGLPHLGKTFMNLRFNLSDNAQSCIFEKIGCLAKGPKAYLIERKLKRIRRLKKPIKRLRKLGPWLSKALMKPEKFNDFMKFIGGKNISLDMWLEGDVISRDRYIHLKTDSLKI
ncbi:MAG: hypothetical protein DRQ88_02360 [Epsilonproteobacteria bacterium]|nr:MAG: hypothetical protein DRQ89_02495 [Campylobacterota bacterium]RLA67512.1 MAG: hypothetical protein DRQ88_02360 [Campylobacterota bacterium]